MQFGGLQDLPERLAEVGSPHAVLVEEDAFQDGAVEDGTR